MTFGKLIFNCWLVADPHMAGRAVADALPRAHGWPAGVKGCAMASWTSGLETLKPLFAEEASRYGGLRVHLFSGSPEKYQKCLPNLLHDGKPSSRSFAYKVHPRLPSTIASTPPIFLVIRLVPTDLQNLLGRQLVPRGSHRAPCYELARLSRITVASTGFVDSRPLCP